MFPGKIFIISLLQKLFDSRVIISLLKVFLECKGCVQ